MTISQKYKHTDLGLIPTDWEVVKLSEVIDNFTGLTYTPNNVKEYGILVLRSSNIQNGMLSFMDNVYVDNIDIPKRVIVQNDDILVCVRNGSKALIGKSALIYGAHKRVMAFGAFMTILRTKGKNSNKYIHYVWQSSIIQKQIEENLGATINQITNNDINTYIIPLPPLPEQRAIADALSDVNDLITALDKKIAKKRLIKQGAMQQLLTGKKRLKGFTEEWMEKTIEELGSLTGAGIDKKLYKDETPIRLVNYTDIFKRDYIYQNELDFWVTANEGKKNQCNVLKGDIFFTPSSEMPYDIALSALAMEDMPNICYSYHIYRLRLNEDIDFLYRAYMFKSDSFYSQANQTCEGSGKRYVISLSKFKQMTVTYPSSQKEQRAIATILFSMDTEITNLEQKRNKYITIKQGMMQKLLIGQIRLTKPQTLIQPLLPNVIAGHIVNTLYQSQGWGRTKLQKALHLSSYYSQSDLGACYIRNTAGPDDQNFMNQIDLKFKQYHHVEVFPNITLDGKKHYVYRPTEDIHILEKVYDGYPEITRQKIDFILSKMSSWDLAQSEIISTLYAVWNNRLIKNQPISDELLLTDFYKWSEHKSEYSSAKVLKMLDYMRKENIIPIGWGKYIEDREDW